MFNQGLQVELAFEESTSDLIESCKELKDKCQRKMPVRKSDTHLQAAKILKTILNEIKLSLSNKDYITAYSDLFLKLKTNSIYMPLEIQKRIEEVLYLSSKNLLNKFPNYSKKEIINSSNDSKLKNAILLLIHFQSNINVEAIEARMLERVFKKMNQ